MDWTPYVSTLTAVAGAGAGAYVASYLKGKRETEGQSARAEATDAAKTYFENAINSKLDGFEIRLIAKLNGTYGRSEWLQTEFGSIKQRISRLERKADNGDND